MHCLPLLTQSGLPGSFLNISERQADAEVRFMRNLLQLIKYDQEEVDSIVFQNPPDPAPIIESVAEEPQAKKRKYTARVLTGIPDDLLEDAILASKHCDVGVSSAVSDRTQYDLFCEKLHLEDGLVQWRLHSHHEEVVIMNDYSPTTGQWKSLDYVHVTASFTDPAEVQIRCTCKSYEYMQGMALQKVNLDLDDDTVLSLDFTCMHCRFFAQFLQPIHESFLSQDIISPMHKKVFPTLKEVNNPVLLLGVASATTTTKLSVVGRDSTTPALVHIYFTPTGCYAKCQDGMCSALHNIKKKIPRGISLKDLEKGQMCDHIFTLYHNQDYLEELFPDYFQPSDQTLDVQSGTMSNANSDLEIPVNTEDIEVRDYDPGTITFNINAGKWQCKSHSAFRPKDSRYDPDLIKGTQERLSHCNGAVNSKGYYKGPDLFPSQPSCAECGEVFHEGTDMQFRTVVVYSRNVSIFVHIL